jgi:hypothetical protein
VTSVYSVGVIVAASSVGITSVCGDGFRITQDVAAVVVILGVLWKLVFSFDSPVIVWVFQILCILWSLLILFIEAVRNTSPALSFFVDLYAIRIVECLICIAALVPILTSPISMSECTEQSLRIKDDEEVNISIKSSKSPDDLSVLQRSASPRFPQGLNIVDTDPINAIPDLDNYERPLKGAGADTIVFMKASVIKRETSSLYVL